VKLHERVTAVGPRSEIEHLDPAREQPLQVGGREPVEVFVFPSPEGGGGVQVAFPITFGPMAT
jgi:hypothetical protein